MYKIIIIYFDTVTKYNIDGYIDFADDIPEENYLIRVFETKLEMDAYIKAIDDHDWAFTYAILKPEDVRNIGLA